MGITKSVTIGGTTYPPKFIYMVIRLQSRFRGRRDRAKIAYFKAHIMN